MAALMGAWGLAVGADCTPESAGAGVHLVLDEHVVVEPHHDRDYTGGGEVTFSGTGAASNWISLDPLLGGIDRLASLGEPNSTLCPPSHAIAGGLMVFTPSELEETAPVPGDRPYASLFFLSNGRQYVRTDGLVAYNSSLTMGALGLRAADTVQKWLHRLSGSQNPQGWSHQISAGGEPTARYSLTRQQRLFEGGTLSWDRYDFKWTLSGSVGTITEGSLGLTGRVGLIKSPWWSLAAEQNTYIQDTHPGPPPMARHSGVELFMFFGGRTKVRPYNAFLEGQFRHSDLRYSYSDLNQVLGEAWLGAELRHSSGFEIRFLTRWESSELRTGIGSHSIKWASVEFAKSWRSSAPST
jgi:hypothetical protein